MLYLYLCNWEFPELRFSKIDQQWTQLYDEPLDVDSFLDFNHYGTLHFRFYFRVCGAILWIEICNNYN